MTFVLALYVVLKRVYTDSELVRSKFSQPITKISTNEIKLREMIPHMVDLLDL